MIDRTAEPVAWAQFAYELTDAHEHLGELINVLDHEAIDDTEFAVHLGHVYAHLNRAWHCRNQTTEISVQQWNEISAFPTDIRPIA